MNKINELTSEEILNLYALLWSVNKLEEEKGNTLDRAWINIKYTTNMTISENINIFNLIRKGTFYEICYYFLKFEERFATQSDETKLNIDDYFVEMSNFSQKIHITFVFNIETTETKIREEAENMILQLKLTGATKLVNFKK